MTTRIHSPRTRGIKAQSIAALVAILVSAQTNPEANATPPPPAERLPEIELTVLGTYASGIFNAGSAEIAAHDPLTQRLYVVNAQAATVDVLNIRNPARPRRVGQIALSPYGGIANSVSVRNGLVAVAIEATPNRTDPGKVIFFDDRLSPLSVVTVGAIPDMLSFTHGGRYVLVANEGEPSGYGAGKVDPEGSVSLIDLLNGPASLTQANVRTAGFSAFNGMEATLRAAGIRIYGPGSSVAQDLEPEFLAISPDDSTAWVTLQENNALAVLDIASATVTALIPLGLKDHNVAGNGLDPSDRDNAAGTGPAIKIGTWPVKGMYQPDGIATFQAGGQTFLLLANEGDAREWPGLVEETTVGATNYILDETVFPNADLLKTNSALGRLRVTKSTGDLDGDGDYDEIHSFGGRSFSIRSVTGDLVFDSGDDFEQILALLHPEVIFNASHDNNSFDSRSRSKGPEPEGVAVGHAFHRTWAVIGLERIGGVMVYDVTNPASPRFGTYANNRNFLGAFAFATAGDLGPEGVLFIEEGNSPTGQPLIVTANEISGTTTIYQVNDLD
jgi:hypothetical protein